MTNLPISEAREHLADLGNRVSLLGERVVVQRRGKDIFALVPIEDVELLERMEDQFDLRQAREALAEPGENTLWTALKKELNL